MDEKELTKRMHTEHEIIICDKCQGSGVYKHKELINYHHGEYEINEEKCKKCEGTGRLFKTKKWVEFYEPFNIKKVSNKNVRLKI